MYLQEKDKMVFSNSTAVGVRRDLHGVLMLDSALQTPVNRTEDTVRLELQLAEVKLHPENLNNLQKIAVLELSVCHLSISFGHSMLWCTLPCAGVSSYNIHHLAVVKPHCSNFRITAFLRLFQSLEFLTQITLLVKKNLRHCELQGVALNDLFWKWVLTTSFLTWAEVLQVSL